MYHIFIDVPIGCVHFLGILKTAAVSWERELCSKMPSLGYMPQSAVTEAF